MNPSSSSPIAPAAGSKPSKARRHSRNGHVARLPKILRDSINEMLRDGLTYPAIIKKLRSATPPLPHSISGQKLSNWKNGGHQDWLKEQAWCESTRTRQESALDLVSDFDATQVNHAALQIATLHVFEALRDLGTGTLDEKLGGDSAAFARLLNALSRASKETLHLQKYQDACAKARALLQSLRDPNRKLSEKERRALILQVDEILGLHSDGAQDEDATFAAATRQQKNGNHQQSDPAHAPASKTGSAPEPPEPRTSGE